MATPRTNYGRRKIHVCNLSRSSSGVTYSSCWMVVTGWLALGGKYFTSCGFSQRCGWVPVCYLYMPLPTPAVEFKTYLKLHVTDS